MRALVIPAVLAAGIVCAPLAHADPASDNDQYDQYLISHGVDGDLLDLGHAQCAALRAGSSERVLIGALETPAYSAYGLGRAGAEDVVYAAHRYLCPGA